MSTMDERNWWFASKLQETFHFSSYDNPSLLEDFLSDFEVAETIAKFLGPGEPRKLFFYCEEEEEENGRAVSASRQLRVTSHVSKDIFSGNKVCLYVLRKSTEGEIDESQLDRQLFCGELRHSVISSLSTLLKEAYAPLLRHQSNWGNCTDENITNFLETFERLSSAVSEYAVEELTHRAILQPLPVSLREVLQQQHHQNSGRLLVSPEVVELCEELLSDWIDTIDSLLLEATDER